MKGFGLIFMHTTATEIVFFVTCHIEDEADYMIRNEPISKVVQPLQQYVNC
jgi:hypothetical protein